MCGCRASCAAWGGRGGGGGAVRGVRSRRGGGGGSWGGWGGGGAGRCAVRVVRSGRVRCGGYLRKSGMSRSSSAGSGLRVGRVVGVVFDAVVLLGPLVGQVCWVDGAVGEAGV